MKRYNVAINWNSLDDCYFAKIIRKLCKDKKLSFLWIHDGNSKKTLRGLYSQHIHIDVLIDTDATYNDPEDLYSRICYAVKDSQGVVINDPDSTQFAINKAIMCRKIVCLGLNTPYTAIIRKWQPKRVTLTEKQKSLLGLPFIIKPAQGYGQRGIIRQATGTPYCIAKARSFDANDDFLLQKMVEPIYLEGKKFWFRVFRIFDRILPCWWDDKTNRYEHINRYEFKKYRLNPLFDIAVKIGQATGMVWFSSEVAVIENKKGFLDYVIIDYVNDQCDMTPVSQTPSGIPNHVAHFTAKILVANSLKILKNKQVKQAKFTLYLK